jgi:hypothetical protein
MRFTKTIIHVYSDIYRFRFNDFIIGTLSLLQYGFDNGIQVKVNIVDSYISQYVKAINMDTQGFTGKDYSNDTDLAQLYSDLEDFKTNTAPFFIVTTNWRIHSSRVSEFAILEFKKMILFNSDMYAQATQRVRSQILNRNLPHTDPIITTLIPQNHVCIRDPRIHDRPPPPTPLATDYSIIYIDIHERVCLKYLDTLKLADTIRKSLILDKNILLLSSNKVLANSLNELLVVNYTPNLVLAMGDASGSLESVIWEPVDEIVNCILIANAKKLFIFSEQSTSVSEEYMAYKQIGRGSVQVFKFFYSKIEISPMPIYR